MGTRTWLVVALAAATAAGCGSGGDAEPPAGAAARAPAEASGGGAAPTAPAAPLEGATIGAGLRIWFQVDPAADAWSSPATFTAVDPGDEAVLRLGARLGGEAATAAWSSADPEIAALSAREGAEVELRVRRTGRTSLRVEHEAGLAILVVRALHDGRGWRVDVTQR